METTENITPKNNLFLLGQEEAEKVMLDAYNRNSLHNSWLISGVKGIGKATLAYRFARFLLDEKSRGGALAESLNTSPDSASNRLINRNAHPDLKIIERDFVEADRKKILKAIKDGEAMSEAELGNLKKSAFIRIDDVRTINEFLSKKSSDNGWRVVIIDSIDDMNTASANALLKVLEEPPAKSILLLISHNSGGLLPTIRSRCAKLVLKPLTENVVISLLRRYRPELDETTIKGLAAMSAGSIGKAISFADNNALGVYAELKDLIFAGPKVRLDNVLAWVDAAASGEDSFNLACELILKFCSDNLASCRNVEDLAAFWEEAIRIFRQTESLNMDKKQALFNVVMRLNKTV